MRCDLKSLNCMLSYACYYSARQKFNRTRMTPMTRIFADSF